MISLNHSSGLLGVDCDNTPSSIIVCAYLSVLYDCDIIRINSFRRYGRLQAGRRQAVRARESNLQIEFAWNK